jgi:serine/threonine-protein kinase
MAPEQMRSAKDVDTRADIWSLGAMLYEMLTAQPPYTGESIPQLCAALLHDDPIPLRQHRPEIPEGLEQAVLRCLMKDRNHRFPTVFELGRALLPYAMPDSRIHVERAERVLGVTDVTMSGMSPSMPIVSRAPAASVPITPLHVTPSGVMPHIEPTVNSWGASGMVPAPKKSKAPLIAIAGAAALIAAAVGLWAARSRSAEEKAASPNLPPSAEPVKAVEAPKTAPVPTAEPVATVAVAATSAEPPAALAPTISKPKTAALVAKPPAAKPDPKKPEPTPAPVTTPKPGGITDFGGRR